MSKKMERIIATYKHVAQNSSPLSGRILKESSGGIVTVSSIWSQRNIERKVNLHSELVQMVNLATKEIHSLPPIDITSEIMTCYSPSSKYRGVLRDIPAAGKSPKKQHLEVWNQSKLWKVFDLTTIDAHGDVCADGEFGTFEWSPCETKILYVAEKKQPKAEPFLPRKPDKPDDETKKGCEYELTEDWGEQLVGKSTPVLCLFDLEREDLTAGLEDGSLSSADSSSSSCSGQGLWAPGGGLVAVSWPVSPWRLGLIYCTNRESHLFHLTPDSVRHKLSGDGVSVRSPSFSPDGSRLIWLERPAGGPHHACHRLMLMEWSSQQISIAIDIVQDKIQTANGQPFYGLYNLDLKRCWLSNSKIVFSTPQRASIRTFIFDFDKKELTSLSAEAEEEGGSSGETEPSLCLLDVKGDLILCSSSSLLRPPRLQLGRLSADPLPTVTWIHLVSQEPLLSNTQVGLLELSARSHSSPVSDYCALYMVPKDISDGPFIVWSHGGPHSLFTNSFSLMATFFASLGFGMVMVNYRGSTGSGQSSVDFLPGKVGETDVADVQEAAETVLDLFPTQLSREKCLLFGGSHGGFLSLHLSAQFPKNYISCVALNPVVDLSGFSISDIPDWAAVEAGFEYSRCGQLTGQMFDKMRSLSPLSRVSAVTAPTLLLLGKKDLRVPYYQGLTYYHQLKALGVKTRALLYEDNHALSQLPHEIDLAINTALWFMDSLGSSQAD